MMRWKTLAAAALLLFGTILASPVLAAEDEGPERLGEEQRAELLLELTDLATFDVEAWQREVLIERGDLDALLYELEQVDADAANTEAQQLGARWVRALLLARRGDLEKALTLFEYFSRRDDARLEAKLERAQLLYMLGREPEALEAYEALLPELTDEATEAQVRTRVALLQMERTPEELHALAEFACEEGRDPALRNRAAVVLGLIGRPRDAMDLYEISGEDTDRFRQEIRVAEWAIRADEPGMAQDLAWSAVWSAKLRRDRFYALTILVEAYRLGDSVDALIDRLAETPDLDEDSRGVWIDLLRERGRVAEAIELFRSAAAGTFSVEERRELLEMYRESGDDEVMIEVFGELIAEEPQQLEWREGLSRAHLELGDREAGIRAWRTLVDDPAARDRWLGAAQLMMDLGLDELAIETAERCIEIGEQPLAALFFLFDLHRDRGRLEEAEAVLERIDERAEPGAPERFQLADAWERLGRLEHAIDELEAVRAARGSDAAGEDLEMRLAWLYSEVGEEEIALDRWTALWRRLESVSRRRYAEDRLMTVASRLGTLADIAIDLEQKLQDGTATERDSGLLVRLYTKVGDSVSATEVVEEFLRASGGSVLDALQEKARVYLSCNDYYDYEKTIRRLIEVDPEGEGDYLRQLAMSQLERGKPQEAREVLQRLQEIEMGTESAEFEAGVLSIAGMREEAIRAYWRGLAANPERIESYLLMANLMRDIGQQDRAIGMFQHLVATADRDDLFTIAIDGLLNLEAPAPVMKWARRVTLERLAARHDKMYLYQLLADLSEAVEDREGMITALEGSLSISGERRPQILRELMELARGGGTSFTGRGWQGDPEKHLAFGRRLIGLAEVVPPQVYLDLGEAFLANDEPANAKRTFRLASDLPDFEQFQRRTAGLFEAAGYRKEALETYRRVLVAQSSDVGLMVKVGELEEQGGRDRVAEGLYRRAIDLLYSRLPLSTTKAEDRVEASSPHRYYGSRNIDAFDEYHDRLRRNLLVVLDEPGDVEALLAGLREAIDADLAALAAAPPEEAPANGNGRERSDTLTRHPRVLRRSDLYRRVAIAFDRVAEADALDLRLLATFPEDDGLLEALCQDRLRWGLYGSVRTLLDDAARPEEEREGLRYLVGDGLDERSARRLPVNQAERLFFTPLITGRNADAGLLIRRTDFARIEEEDLDRLESLFSASIFMRDANLTLRIAREWVRLSLRHGTSSYMIERLLERCKGVLAYEDYRNLCLSVTDQILEDPKKQAGLLTILPSLQEDFEEPLITEEQVLEILDELGDGGWGYGLGPVVELLPEEKRGAAMRSIWSKIKPTSRAQFLMNLIDDAQAELGDSVSEFVRGAITGALEDADRVYPHYVSSIAESRHNHQLGLDVLDILVEREPHDPVARSARAVKLLVLGREEEALPQALEVYTELIDDDGSDYQKRQAVDRIVEKFVPHHLDAFLAALAEREAQRGKSLRSFERRIELYEQVEDEDAITTTLEEAIAELPEEKKLLERLENQYNEAGRRQDSLEIAMRLAALDPDHKRALAMRWRSLDNPVQALKIVEELLAESEDAGLGSSIPGVPAGVVLPRGARVITPAGSFVVGAAGSRKVGEAMPTMQRVKEAAQAEDWDTARTVLRRLWRDFPVEESSRRYGSNTYYFGGDYGRGLLTWPEDSAEETGGGKPNRGGLDTWSDEEPEPPADRETAFEKLAEYDFGADELERMLRAKDPLELEYERDLFDGLLHARVLREGGERTRDALVAAVVEGRGSNVETKMLLTLLDRHPELADEGTRAVVEDLLREVRPTDVGSLRSLARVYARQGDRIEARRLYTWCATRTERSGFSSFGSAPTIDPRELLREVGEQLEGEDRLAVVDAVIDFANPRDYPWARQQFELLVLETYLDLLEPAEVVERCREVLEGATDFREGLRRDTAKRAAAVWARAGELESALHCLEYGLCSLPEDVVEGEEGYWNTPETPGYLWAREIRQLLPANFEAFVAPREWFVAASSALREWLDEGRLREDAAWQALVILALRLKAVGEEEGARELVSSLAARDDLDPTRRLWVVDAARELGETALADAIERELFEAGQLHLERLHEVVRRELESAGPEAALELGERVIDYTLQEKLLEVLVEAAERTGDAGTIERWTTLKAKRDAAAARLEELDEEQRRAAEGEEE